MEDILSNVFQRLRADQVFASKCRNSSNGARWSSKYSLQNEINDSDDPVATRQEK